MANNTRKAVRVWCAEHDETQVSLATRLGVSESLFSKILAGYRKPTPELSEAIKAATGVYIEPETSEVTR